MNDLIMKFSELDIDERFFFEDREYRKIPSIFADSSYYNAYSIDDERHLCGHQYVKISDDSTVHRATF